MPSSPFLPPALQKGAFAFLFCYSLLISGALIYQQVHNAEPSLPDSLPATSVAPDPEPLAAAGSASGPSRDTIPLAPVPAPTVSKAPRDPRAAWLWLRAGKAENPTRRECQKIAAALVQAEGVKACEEIFQTTGPWSAAARSAALMTLAANSPAEFLTFTKTHAIPMSSGFAGVAARWLARSHPETAIEWATTLPPGMSDHALSGAVSGWFSRDPEAATEWLNQNRSAFRSDSAIVSIVNEIPGDDAPARLAWAAEIRDPATRIRAVERSLLEVAATDPTAAAEWIAAQTDLPQPEKLRLAGLLEDGALLHDGNTSRSNFRGAATITE